MKFADVPFADLKPKWLMAPDENGVMKHAATLAEADGVFFAVVPMMDPALMPKGAWPWILLGTNLANAWLRVIISTVIATPSRTE